MPATTKPVTRVATVIIPVGDQEKAVDFYCRTLGFEKRRDVPMPNGERWIEVAPPGGETSIAVMPARNGHLKADIGLSTDDADAAHAHLVACGCDVDDAVMRVGQGVPPMFTFRDPDGNQFRMVELEA